MAEKLLEIENLCVEYNTEIATVYAVNGLSLSLNYGETLGLVGETGAGKTTTCLSVMRLLPEGIGEVTDGRIILDGHDMMALPEEKVRDLRGNTVSMIFQDPMSSLNPVMTVGDQIKEVLKIHNKDMHKNELDKAVDNMMEMVGIPANRKNEYPHEFSGGMKQRIVIAIALVCEPKLILADEPTTALDVTIQAQMLGLINDLQKRLNTAMILVTWALWRRPVKRWRSCIQERQWRSVWQSIFSEENIFIHIQEDCLMPFPSWIRIRTVWKRSRE